MPYGGRGRRVPMRHERPWVFAGAVVLAGVAGYINVVGLNVFHVPVSHMTGAVSRLSIDLAQGDALDVQLVLTIVGGFMLGAIVSGLVIGGRKLQPGRRYGVALLIEGATLAVATALLLRDHRAGVSFAAMACGIQNAMASSYYGLILRTTHVTGIVTDLGVMLGHWVRHRAIPRWKPLLLTSLLVSFFVGGVVGQLLFTRLGVGALALASGGCLSAGSIYYLWRTRLRRPASRGRSS